MNFFHFQTICIIWILVIIIQFIDGCQIDNKMMHVCLHTYLERDFSIIEELLKRPPYSKNGHILIEESEYEDMCLKIDELKHCYERMMSSCISFVQYDHMKRVIKTLRSLYENLCGQSFLIRYLIEGGYCIEYIRQESICLDSNPNNTIPSLPERQRWPFSLTSMFRFEIGHQICPYLSSFNQCLSPFIDLRCPETTRELWNKSMNSLLSNWCHNNSIIMPEFSVTNLIILLLSHLIILRLVEW
ncbi:uncharacterized protein LOC113794219 [Dermatophagoides pteronyssinus]|uniref:uncharacterized protein LOC113794219 n=1 Tax=Dermatophagoides pteronyssinus TaxID=6956 RepID=UPI003F680F4D